MRKYRNYYYHFFFWGGGGVGWGGHSLVVDVVKLAINRRTKFRNTHWSYNCG